MKMTGKNTFDILLLIARPAAGKSEIMDFLKRTPLEDRIKRFHIGKIDEIDDFPMLWTWFEEDALLEKMGKPRLHSDKDGYFLEQYFWNLLIERIGLEYQKKLRDIPNYEADYSTLVEFSRGKEHGGYRSALQHLSPLMLKKMVVMYINVSWEESLRKNRKRFNPHKPDSILEHALPDAKLEHLYREVDWDEISSVNPTHLSIQGHLVPYVVFDNSDDVTSQPGEALGTQLEDVLTKLWSIYNR
jgi:hypothetical protein